VSHYEQRRCDGVNSRKIDEEILARDVASSVVDQLTKKSFTNKGRVIKGQAKGLAGSRRGTHKRGGGAIEAKFSRVARQLPELFTLTSPTITQRSIKVTLTRHGLLGFGVTNNREIAHVSIIAHNVT